MNIDHIRDHCLAKKGATEEFPFDESTLVFKVLGKIFLIAPLDRWDKGEGSINLKCDPDYSEELRAEHHSIRGGYHQNKKHWNTLHLYENALDTKLIVHLIDHSYDMVVKGMPKKLRDKLV